MEVRGQSSFHGKFLFAHTQTPWKSGTARKQLSAKWPEGKHVILGWRGTRQRRVKNGILLKVWSHVFFFFFNSIYSWWTLGLLEIESLQSRLECDFAEKEISHLGHFPWKISVASPLYPTKDTHFTSWHTFNWSFFLHRGPILWPVQENIASDYI